MDTDTLTQEKFDALSIPENEWRLDRLLKPHRNPATGKTHGGFETLDLCWAEDRRRARGLRKLRAGPPTNIFPCDPESIADSLEKGAEQQCVPACFASAAYTRSRRLPFLGQLLKFLNENSDLDMELISVMHPEWCFDVGDDFSALDIEIWEGFTSLLDGVRLSDFPGFLVAFLSGAYDVHANKIQLMLRGVCGGEKQRATMIWDRDEHDKGLFCIGGHSVRNLPRQICGIMPNRICEGAFDYVSLTDACRMREPFHSVYLMWLAQHSPADRLYLDGVTIDEGSLVLE